jgi:hypothetical protein
VAREQADVELKKSLLNSFLVALTVDSRPYAISRLQMTLLSVLFNMLEKESSFRHKIFVAIMKFAQKTGQTSLLEGQFASLGEWLNEWKLDNQQAADLYLTASEVVTGDVDTQQKYLLAYLSHMEESKGPDRSAAEQIAVKACVTAIQNFQASPEDHPWLDCSRLLSHSIVQELEKNANFKPLFELVNIFANHTITEYLVFAQDASNVKTLQESFGIDHEETVSKLRTVTLCCMGLDKEELLFSELQSKLQVADTLALEAAVIDAVMSGRLEAKIDQDKEVVAIQRSTSRQFQKDDWAGLLVTMDRWNNKIGSVLNNLQSEGA